MTTADRLAKYAELIAAKRRRHDWAGFQPEDPHPCLFDFQVTASAWALRKGRAAIFAGTGLGKTMMFGEYVRQIKGKRLVVAPLAVSFQIQQEFRRLGIESTILDKYRQPESDGVYIINYDRVEPLNVEWDAVVLDESSIIKNYNGATYALLLQEFGRTNMRLACTATPAPNDYMELGTHAEFLGVMTRQEMLATYFTHDGGNTSKWRLKRHARKDFWAWVSSWGLMFSHPRQLGSTAEGYDLPPLNVHEHYMQSEPIDGGLFASFDGSATGLYRALSATTQDRAEKAHELASVRPFLFWCNTNAEQDAIERLIPGVASVRGDTDRDMKAKLMVGFANGDYPALVTKPKIAGFGMNWQRCANMAFVGTTFSFEQTYQAIRRCYRFGQKSPVTVHLICDEAMAVTIDALKRKDDDHNAMIEEAIKYAEL